MLAGLSLNLGATRMPKVALVAVLCLLLFTETDDDGSWLATMDGSVADVRAELPSLIRSLAESRAEPTTQPVREDLPDYDALALKVPCVPSEWLPYLTVDLREIGRPLCAPRQLPPDVVAAMSATVSAEQFARLPLAPSPITVQPPHGWAFVNMDTIVYTDAASQVLPTTVLGFGVEVEATPIRYTVDFGDGSEPLVTEDPGAPWPNPTITHVYTQPGQVTITVSTTWSGRFRVLGYTGWRPVLGYATTTSAAPPLDILEARTHLVSGPEG
jgi:hypothetical protein